MLSDAELLVRIEALLRANDFGLDHWSSHSGNQVTMTYRFETGSTADFPWSNVGLLGAYSEAQKVAVRTALAEIETYINVRFVEDNSTADADFSYFISGDLYTDDPNTTGSGGRGRWQYSNGVWDGWAVFREGRAIESWSDYDLVLHELGHTLGLKHPGNYDVGGGGTPGPYLPANEDSDRYTVMSYSVNPVTNQEARHMMLYDIAALQHWWGVNNQHETGNNVYTGPDDGRVQVIWDAGGVDSFSHAGSGAAHIDLREGAFSSMGGLDNLAVAYGTEIENAAGGNANDTLIGNDLSNYLDGGAGADILDGGAGADTLNGGGGNDTYRVDNAGDMVIEDSLAGGDDVIETLVSFDMPNFVERLTMTGAGNSGTNGNDLANIINGNSGNNYINGGAGTDLMTGGSGNDTYTIDNLNDVIVELAGGGDDAVYSFNDAQLSGNIETLILASTASNAISGFGDGNANQIFGNEFDNVIFGRGGLDRLGGGAGDDIFVIQNGDQAANVQEQITDFEGAGVAGGDRMAFGGFGPGAMLVQVSTSSYEVRDANNVAQASFVLEGVTIALTADDYYFA